MRTRIGLWRLLPVLLLAAPAIALAQADCGEDELTAEVSGSTVALQHANAHYNCCTTVTFAVEAVPGGYRVTETEGGPLWCYCTCCFTLWAWLTDVPPGPQTITLSFFDYDRQAWRELAVSVVVPDVGQGGAGGVDRFAKSACGGVTAVNPADEGGPAATWGALKAAYR